MAQSIEELLKRVDADMASSGSLSRGTYFDCYEHALNGEEFCATMSIRDAYKMRALLNRHGVKGVMRQQIKENGQMRVCFNI